MPVKIVSEPNSSYRSFSNQKSCDTSMDGFDQISESNK